MGNSFWLLWEPDFIVFLQNRINPAIQKIFESLTFFGDVYALIIIIGLSRSILGVHYPSDVLAGWLVSSLTIFIISKIKNINIVYAIILILGVIGCFFNRSTDYYSTLGIAFGFIAGFIYEEKHINFKNTKNVLRMILRTIGGLIVFVVLDTVLKLPFSETFLASNTMVAFLIRSLRYAIVSFVLIGVYPRLFGFVDNKIEKNINNK